MLTGRTFTIAGKEIRGFFTSPGFYLISCVSAIIYGGMYYVQLNGFSQMLSASVMNPNAPKEQMNIQTAVFMQHLGILNLLLLLIVPAFAMRLLSEEKKNRTFDLLMTSPISSLDIVIGKFLAMCFVMTVFMALAISAPLLTTTFATVHWPSFAISFGAILALGYLYSAIDLFCSSLTESVFISFVISLLLNIFVWFIASGSQMVDSNLGRQIFEHISLGNHLGELVNGSVRTSSLVYIVSLIVLFVFLAERVIESSRWRST